MVKLVPLVPLASSLETLMPGVYLSLSMALAVPDISSMASLVTVDRALALSSRIMWPLPRLCLPATSTEPTSCVVSARTSGAKLPRPEANSRAESVLIFTSRSLTCIYLLLWREVLAVKTG